MEAEESGETNRGCRWQHSISSGSARGSRSATLKRPIPRLSPLEFSVKGTTGDQMDTLVEESSDPQSDEPATESTESPKERPRWTAFIRAQDKVRSWSNDLNLD